MRKAVFSHTSRHQVSLWLVVSNIIITVPAGSKEDTDTDNYRLTHHSLGGCVDGSLCWNHSHWFLHVVCISVRVLQRNSQFGEFILRIWFTQLLRMASLKLTGLASRPTIPARVEIEVLSPKAVWGENSRFLEGTPVLLRISTKWMRLTHIVESNLLYSKSTDLNVNGI